MMTKAKNNKELISRNMPEKEKSMSGKVCLVTGATSGIGKVTATELAARGADVILHGRDRQKTELVRQEIIASTGNVSVQTLLADFSNLDQVRSMAAKLIEGWDQVDVLINNAGAFFNTRHTTPYGVEMTFLVNHLAPFLLTTLLIEKLQRSTAARVVNVSSDAHHQGSIDLDDLEFNKGYFGMKAYARSKLANILFTYELAGRLDNGAVTVNALHPGHVATDIWKTNFPLIGPVLKWVMGLIAISPKEGADNSIYLASSPQIHGVTGKYFVKRVETPSSPLSRDKGLAQMLWERSENLVNPS
jgi:NAD(P)-dependent dehydrogenase (short-subunit alcohol dehydrogenase family)